jgi:hypothetical protein
MERTKAGIARIAARRCQRRDVSDVAPALSREACATTSDLTSSSVTLSFSSIISSTRSAMPGP